MMVSRALLVLISCLCIIEVSSRVCRQKVPKNAYKRLNYQSNSTPGTSNLIKSSPVCSPTKKISSVSAANSLNSKITPCTNKNARIFTNNTVTPRCDCSQTKIPYKIKCQDYINCNCIKQQPGFVSSDPFRIPSCLSQNSFPEVEYPLSAMELWMPNFWEYNSNYIMPKNNNCVNSRGSCSSTLDSERTYKPANKGVEKAIQALISYQNKNNLAQNTTDTNISVDTISGTSISELSQNEPDIPIETLQDPVNIVDTSASNDSSNTVLDTRTNDGNSVLNTPLDEIVMETTMSPLDIYEDFSRSTYLISNDESFFNSPNEDLLAPGDTNEFITLPKGK